LGFTEEKLLFIFDSLEEIEIRRMKEARETDGVFGVSALFTALFRKK